MPPDTYDRHAVNGVPIPMRSQLRARGVWLPRDEQDAVEWRRGRRARIEAPSEVDVLLAVRQSPRCAEAPRDLAGRRHLCDRWPRGEAHTASRKETATLCPRGRRSQEVIHIPGKSGGQKAE